MRERKIQPNLHSKSAFATARGELYQRCKRASLAASLTGIAVFGYFSGLIPSVNLGPPPAIQHAAAQLPQDWKWADIQPRRDLEWHKCYKNKFDCARLDVSGNPQPRNLVRKFADRC